MAWFKGTGTDFWDILDVIKNLAKDDHISVAAINTAGTGYAVGDTITLAGGTKYHEPEIEVTGVSGGVITSVHISDAGVYTAQASNPVAQNTTSGSGTGADFNLTYLDTAWETLVDFEAEEATVAAIGTAGTGYTADDVVTVVGGSFTVATTVQIDTVGGSGEALTVSVYTEAGEYITTPANDAATSGGTGTGLELTMTWAATTDERKYLMLHNTTTDQYIGWKAFKWTTPEDAYLLQCNGFTGFDSVSIPWDQHPGSMADKDDYVPLSGGGAPATVNYWLSIQDLRITGSFKVASVYPNMYLGSPDPFLTAGEYAYPQLILGCMARKSPYTYGAADFAGMTNPGAWNDHASYDGPGYLRTPSGTLEKVLNWHASGSNFIVKTDDYVNIGPAGGSDYTRPDAPNQWYTTSRQNWREIFTESLAIATDQDALKRVNSLFMLVPCPLVSKTNNRLYGHLRGIFALDPDAAANAEDRIYIGSVVYRCFQNATKSNKNYFYCIRED